MRDVDLGVVSINGGIVFRHLFFVIIIWFLLFKSPSSKLQFGFNVVLVVGDQDVVVLVLLGHAHWNRGDLGGKAHSGVHGGGVTDLLARWRKILIEPYDMLGTRVNLPVSLLEFFGESHP